MEESSEINKRKVALKNKLEKIIKRKISTTSFVVRDREGRFETIRTDYDPKEFGFAAGKFIFVSDECDKIALCVGVGVDVDGEGDEELWFLMENGDGIVYWKGNRSNDFVKEGFTLLI